jgi:hypothetical protein
MNVVGGETHGSSRCSGSATVICHESLRPVLMTAARRSLALGLDLDAQSRGGKQWTGLRANDLDPQTGASGPPRESS